MVRISDLVKGSTPPQPAPKSDDRGEGVRLSNLSELKGWDKKTPPKKESPDKPQDIAPGEQTDTVIEKPQGATQEKTPESAFVKSDVISEDPSLQKVAPHSNTPFSQNGKTLYFNAQKYLLELKEQLIKKRPIHLAQPLEMIEEMIAKPSLVDDMYQLTLAFDLTTDMYIASPINSMIYSFKIGTRMGYTPEMMTEICLAALHHDIGMFLIPDAIIRKNSKLTASEFALIQKHTQTGRDLFLSLNYPNVARAVHEHHERENGMGYPAGIKGDEISEYAKIIGICDSYEAMTHDRPHKKAAAQYLSVLQLAGSKDRLFAPHIVKMFIDVITFYPIGSYVRLNNKAIGLVVETNPNNPLKPIIRVLFDGHGKRTIEEKMINLMENNILTITSGVSKDALPV